MSDLAEYVADIAFDLAAGEAAADIAFDLAVAEAAADTAFDLAVAEALARIDLVADDHCTVLYLVEGSDSAEFVGYYKLVDLAARLACQSDEEHLVLRRSQGLEFLRSHDFQRGHFRLTLILALVRPNYLLGRCAVSPEKPLEDLELSHFVRSTTGSASYRTVAVNFPVDAWAPDVDVARVPAQLACQHVE